MPVVVAAVNTQLGRVKLGDMFSITWEYDVYGTPPTPRDNALTPGQREGMMTFTPPQSEFRCWHPATLDDTVENFSQFCF